MSKNIKIAICYDFDGTLAAGNLQEYNYIPQLKIKPEEFWAEAKERARTSKGDEILTYMCLMLEKAKADTSKNVQVTKKAFASYANEINFFKGVDEWFDKINNYGKECKVSIEHYIISSGIREMIEGTSIAKHFTKIYACAYWYDHHGVAMWPSLAVNYTTKTQFLFRINKGHLEESDDSQINAYQAQSERPIPFSHIIYIGDGVTDVPCMRLVKELGGYSVAVFQPNKKGARKSAEELLSDGRVNLIAPADYSEGTQLDTQIRAIINKIVAENKIRKLYTRLNKKIKKGT